MAKDQVLPFITRLNNDATVRAKVQAASPDGMDGLVKVGKEFGFQFTIEEFQAVALEQSAAKFEVEISEEELSAVVGGTSHPDGTAAHKDINLLE